MIVFGLTAADDIATATGRPLTHARILWQNRARGLTAASVDASSETAEGPRDAPLRPETWEFWEPVALPATWQVDLGADYEIDAIGIAAHTLGTSLVRIAVSAGLSEDIDTDDHLPLFAEPIAPADDEPLLLLDVPRSARFVRLTLTEETTEAVPPRIAVFSAGVALAMERAIYGGHPPITLQRETVLHQALSRGGQFLGQGFRRHGLVTSVAFSNLSAAWVRSELDPFIESARSEPYFFAWRPASFPDEVAFAWTREDIRPVNMDRRGARMSVSWNIGAHSEG